MGEDDKHISVVDGLGVALAAIQGLHAQVQENDREIASLRRQLASMKQELAGVKTGVSDRLAALEKAMSKNVFLQAGFRPMADR